MYLLYRNTSDHSISLPICTGIFGLTPHKAHFCTHASSTIARRLLTKNNRRQTASKQFFNNLASWQQIEIRDYVRVKNSQQLIKKESAVFYRATTEEVYRVGDVDRTQWPYLYSLETYPDKNRKFYAWQLSKVKSAPKMI